MPQPNEFTFTLIQDEDHFGDDSVYAVIMPQGSEEPEDSKKSIDVVKANFPELEYVDDCVMGLWAFPAELSTAREIAQSLITRGFVWDRENQDPSVIDPTPPKPTVCVSRKKHGFGI